ncbi:NADP-dependent oxidoreductase [Nesterenkonia xinjiangensis]|uniref:Enoyl reductase (ER) domain-containing protein n=1 Tax=Nesterenkonia xinjiangensis TaxID=225327 RepID=A0A7Z0GML0_9MICC|nr:NADP-dependent oxidoreductase [Nesterenkonia xinjiangensis]NYJ78685.1 hypothetical protein [Nesterenkonia xinjiangensis]
MTDTSTSPSTSTQVQLVRRPTGRPVPEDFRTVQIELPPLGVDEVRVANEFLSVDPYMRGRMNDVKSYIPPFALDETMTGGAVGRVVESRAESLPVGTPVRHMLGWRDVAQAEADSFSPVEEIPGASLSAHLGILGMTGLTAYVGLTAIADVREGDTVFISGAAGAVGSAAGQIARLLGASQVIGSAGSAEKVTVLTGKYGYDAAINYKDAPVRDQLPEHVPDGVDVFFDNVGGDHLEAALDVMNDGGRIALCGAIASYNAERPAPGPDNLANLITRGLRMQGFTLGGYVDHAPEYQRRMAEWFPAGDIPQDETVVDGIENAVEAFLGMMDGANIGKMLVRTV